MQSVVGLDHRRPLFSTLALATRYDTHVKNDDGINNIKRKKKHHQKKPPPKILVRRRCQSDFFANAQLERDRAGYVVVASPPTEALRRPHCFKSAPTSPKSFGRRRTYGRPTDVRPDIRRKFSAVDGRLVEKVAPQAPQERPGAAPRPPSAPPGRRKTGQNPSECAPGGGQSRRSTWQPGRQGAPDGKYSADVASVLVLPIQNRAPQDGGVLGPGF